MAVAFRLNGGGSITFSCVSKSIPKNGITIVKDTNENKTLNILNRILAVQMANKVLRILKFVRNSALGKDKKGFPIFALWNQQDKKKYRV